MIKYLIVGLGNIGPEYHETRHNIGFMTVEALARINNAPPFIDGRYGFTTSFSIKGRQLILLKPSTFMNLSGLAVRYWMQKENIPLENVLIVVDDLALPFGTLRLKGKGNPGFSGGEAGDLLLKVKVGDRAGFERKGMDVYTNISIPFTTAVLGGEAVVPTLNGNVICKIRPGTQSGSKIRLKGKGIVSMKDRSVHGDEYAVVQIQVPKNLNETAKEKLKEFAKAC